MDVNQERDACARLAFRQDPERLLLQLTDHLECLVIFRETHTGASVWQFHFRAQMSKQQLRHTAH